MKEFDENEAISAMRKVLTEEKMALYSDDDLLEVLDLIFDSYEETGQLDIDFSDDDDSTETVSEKEILSIIEFVTKFIKKDKTSKINIEDIPALVRAEVGYELSLI